MAAPSDELSKLSDSPCAFMDATDASSLSADAVPHPDIAPDCGLAAELQHDGSWRALAGERCLGNRLSNGAWHHLLVEFDGHILRLGVDGYIRESLTPGSVSEAGGAGGAREEEFNSLVGTHFARSVLER